MMSSGFIFFRAVTKSSCICVRNHESYQVRVHNLFRPDRGSEAVISAMVVDEVL